MHKQKDFKESEIIEMLVIKDNKITSYTTGVNSASYLRWGWIWRIKDINNMGYYLLKPRFQIIYLTIFLLSGELAWYKFPLTEDYEVKNNQFNYTIPVYKKNPESNTKCTITLKDEIKTYKIGSHIYEGYDIDYEALYLDDKYRNYKSYGLYRRIE